MEQITFHHLTHRPISYFHIRSEKTKDKRQIPVTICKEEGAPGITGGTQQVVLTSNPDPTW